MNKPIKPNITIPASFADNGVKVDFDNDLLREGFSNLNPDVLAGDNLNKFIDDTYKGLNYGMAAADAINLINEGETLTVVDGKLTSGASGGGGGLQMFDTILKDHVLTYEETKGLALQGTYVYKDAVAGSRYGYPDFYNKCLEEYNNSQVYYKPWSQPIATGETTAIVGGDMVITASSAFTGYDAYKAMDGTSSGTTSETGWGTNNTTGVQWWQVKFPYEIRITGLIGYQRYDTTPANANTIGRFYTSSDKTTPIGDEYNNAVGVNWNSVSVTGIPEEGIITDTIYFEKTGGSTYGGLGELKIEATYTTPLYKHSNGHVFYDISQKNQIDEIFNSTGMAWVYGIDTENERVFLPRDKTLLPFSATTDWENKESKSLTTTYTAESDGYIVAYWTKTTTNTNLACFINGVEVSSCYLHGQADAKYGNSLTIPVGNGDTYQVTCASITNYFFVPIKRTYKDDFHVYICVGNTEVTNSITDVVDVTTTENDTIPLGYSKYQNSMQSSISWLKSQGQWNDGSIYTTFYNEFVNKIGEAFASGYVVEYTSEYTDYDLVINQDDMAFRLPLFDGSENLLSGEYNDLTLGASGSTYIAPANGWFYFSKVAGTSDVWANLINVTANIYTGRKAHDQYDTIFEIVEVKKGDVVQVTYNATGTTNAFRFYYAQGNGSLYFKVANAVQNLDLLNAGEVLEALADKISRVDCPFYVTETYFNNENWYKVYSNGWCEQVLSVALPSQNYGETIANLLLEMKDTTYTIIVGGINTSNNGNYAFSGGQTKTTTTVGIWQERTTGSNHNNHAFVYIAGYKK